MLREVISTLAAIVVVSTIATVPTEAATAEFKGTFSNPIMMTDSELREAQIQLRSEQRDTGYQVQLISPDLVSPNWNYTGLWPGSYIDTKDSYYVSTSGQSVTIKLCQYPNAVFYGGKVAKASYQLIPQGSGVGTIQYTVSGNYDSTNYTFSFHDVQKGTYKLRIKNLTLNGTDPGFDLNGNGFVYYY